MKKRLLLLTNVLFSLSTIAQPTINNINGVVQDAQSVTINGNGFDNMGGQIVSWDNFEAHTINTPIQNSTALIGPNWTCQYGYNDLGARFDNTHSVSGDKAAHIEWGYAPSSGIRAFGWSNQGPFSQLYITYWRYMEGDYSSDKNECSTPDGYNCNHKQYYLFGNKNYENKNEFPQAMPLIPAGTNSWSFYNNVSTAQGSNFNKKGWEYSNTIEKFQRWEFWQKLNTPWNCSENVNCNGELKYWLDGQLGLERNDYRHRFVDGEYKDFRLGHMAGGFSSSAKAWFDDLYIATTQARVELGNASIWTACTERNIQIPTLWTATSIDFSVNQGSFTDCEQVYLYVVDKDGKVNQNGYLVTIAGSGCITGVEKNMETNIQVYPNPTSGELNIEGISATDQITLTMKNILGEEVKINHERFSNKIKINTEHLSIGIYFLNITQDNQESMHKIIKQN